MQRIYTILLFGVGVLLLGNWLKGRTMTPTTKENFLVRRSEQYRYGMSCYDYQNYWARPKPFCGHCIYSPYIQDSPYDRTLRKITSPVGCNL